jgi:hypothetical protein
VPQDYGDSIYITKKTIATFPINNLKSIQPIICYALRNTGALVNYLHKAMFSCTKSALVHAAKKGHLTTWPGLTVEDTNKHLNLTTATAMGHMNKKRQNIRSTKERLLEQEDEDITPLGSGEKKHLVFAVVIDQGQIYTD